MAEVSILMVAGERSGDIYGGQLASALRERLPEVEIFGCGGEEMRRGGVQTAVDSRQFAMMGITEVASGLPRAYRAFHRLLREAAIRKPNLAVLIDSPSLNMRLAKRLKRMGIPVVYFISPQIWAWKKWRLRQLPGLVDRMVCIFDFEEEIYRKVGIPVNYVGHPLVDRVQSRRSRERFFEEAGLNQALPLVALLPGSRAIELRYNLPPIIRAAAQLAAARPIQFVLALAPDHSKVEVESRIRQIESRPLPLSILTDSTYDTLAHATAAVVASGTATVEAALLECPMVVVYRISRVTAFFARFMVNVPFYSMVNLLAGKRVVAELIQKDLTAERIGEEMEPLLDSADRREKMRQELRGIRSRLGGGGATGRAADAMMEMLTAQPITKPL
ncbi:MAG TPA: lipid-A-disaccharide synthase [Terriglobia bacterium]|nr:lipid-A-disaccharide synthase [Terriglobia bacterium]